jgi:hypothetical protein
VRLLAFGQPDRRSVKADRLTLEISTEKKQLSLLKTFYKLFYWSKTKWGKRSGTVVFSVTI